MVKACTRLLKRIIRCHQTCCHRQHPGHNRRHKPAKLQPPEAHSPTSCRSLLPVNYTSYEPDPATTQTDANGTTVNDAFLKMTMSAIPHGSPVLWWAGPAYALLSARRRRLNRASIS